MEVRRHRARGKQRPFMKGIGCQTKELGLQLASQSFLNHILHGILRVFKKKDWYMLSTKSFFSSLIRFITSFTEHLPVESQVVNVTVSNGEELHGLMQDTQHHKKSSADQRLVPHFC